MFCSSQKCPKIVLPESFFFFLSFLFFSFLFSFSSVAGPAQSQHRDWVRATPYSIPVRYHADLSTFAADPPRLLLSCCLLSSFLMHIPGRPKQQIHATSPSRANTIGAAAANSTYAEDEEFDICPTC